LSVFDTFLPLVRGQRIGLFAGSGVGKTTLLGNLARHLSCDVVVVALIGERGREVRDMVDRVLGPAGMRRSVVFSATSDQSPLLRRRAALSAMHCAEHYRAQGFQVLFLLDSLTRLAEAQREIAVAVGEPVALRGFPASVVPLLTGLCERAGPGGPGEGDMTAIFSVLVAGSDMDEPVADLVRGIVDGHVVLDRAIAERGRFPAVDVLASVSRSLEHATSVDERALLADARACLAQLAEARLLLQSGLYASGSDPALDRAVRLEPALDRFLAAPARGGAGESFTRLAAILGGEEGVDGR
jgi:flagellum-specific ATP synthase